MALEEAKERDRRLVRAIDILSRAGHSGKLEQR
jgi:hypothetical protein